MEHCCPNQQLLVHVTKCTRKPILGGENGLTHIRPIRCAILRDGVTGCNPIRLPTGNLWHGWCTPWLFYAWWRHQMETFSALLAICAGNSPGHQSVTRRSDVFFDLRPNKWLSKQSWGWWFQTLSCSLWRHRNGQYVSVWLPINACLANLSLKEPVAIQ